MIEESTSSRVRVAERMGYGEVADYLADPDLNRDYSWKQVCFFTDPVDETDELLSLNTQWDSLPPEDGKSVEYRPVGFWGRGGQLDVLCRHPRGEKRADPPHSNVLAFSIDQELNLSRNSRARLLVTLAEEVTERMDCENAVMLPEPDEIAPP